MIVDCEGISRHVALFCSPAGIDMNHLPIPSSLADRPEGCVVWAQIGESSKKLSVSYGWFGDTPGYALPALEEFQTVRGGPTAFSLIPVDRFDEVSSMRVLVDKILGAK